MTRCLLFAAPLALLVVVACGRGGGGAHTATGPSFIDAQAVAAAFQAATNIPCSGSRPQDNIPADLINVATSVTCPTWWRTGPALLIIDRFKDDGGDHQQAAIAFHVWATCMYLRVFKTDTVTSVEGNGWAITAADMKWVMADYIAGKFGGTATLYTCEDYQDAPDRPFGTAGAEGLDSEGNTPA